MSRDALVLLCLSAVSVAWLDMAEAEEALR